LPLSLAKLLLFWINRFFHLISHRCGALEIHRPVHKPDVYLNLKV
jgi:hypothetical protein